MREEKLELTESAQYVKKDTGQEPAKKSTKEER